ncbi:MAG: AAA family ATPase [Spirochaetaceae bacterium]|nr:MAG: AAA family ATPase [Spirochaetaceae bacterium]
MILSTLQVTSFGALASQHLDLEAGLNVILGPNEAGKSTLFKAIQHLLLTPVNLNKRNLQELIRPLLPLDGGDTVSAAIEFRVDNQPFRLEKTWGGSAAATLHLPDGGRITDPETVEVRLAALLPVQPGTLRTVLLTYQSGLASTMAELEADKETVYGLSDLLHRSVLETDGVSVGSFRELLDRRCQQYLRHWDLQRRRPERKRGADTRWSRERGTVLEAYYALEDAQNRLQEVKDREGEFEKLRERLENCTRELTSKETRLERVELGAKDAEQRSVLEVKLNNAELSLREVRNHYDSWTKSLLRLEALEKELPQLQQTVLDLEREKDRVQAFQQKQNLIERFKRVRSKRERLQEEEAELKRLLPLSRSQLDQLRECSSEIARLGASLKAGNLSLIFHTREAVDLVIQTDMEEPEEQSLSRNKSLNLKAAGKIELRHPSWSLEVYSGEGEFRKVAEHFEQAQVRFSGLLQELKVSSLEEAEETSKRYEAQSSQTQTARALYEQELGSDSFEALEAACEGEAQSHPTRELNEVLEELAEKRSRYQELKDELHDNRQRIETLTVEYADKEVLFARIAELGGIRQQIGEQISALAPLPEGFRDAQSLLDHYKRQKEEVESLRQEKIRLESDCRNAENSLPDESSEEAERRVGDLRDQFNNQVNKAEVLVRINKATTRLLAESHEGIYEPFTALVSRYLATLSDDRYRNVPAGTSLPAGLIRGDGQTVPYQLLSAGTKDLFSLALRLAMAEFFLNSTEGFLILDDPLVDLDPHRQQRAAAVLSEFAEKHQLVMFTCQPGHADLLEGAHRIELAIS